MGTDREIRASGNDLQFGILYARGLNAVHLIGFVHLVKEDWPHEVLVAFQDLINVKNHPCLSPANGGVSLGDLGREIVENNKTLCSLDFLVLLGQAKRIREISDAL